MIDIYCKGPKMSAFYYVLIAATLFPSSFSHRAPPAPDLETSNGIESVKYEFAKKVDQLGRKNAQSEIREDGDIWSEEESNVKVVHFDTINKETLTKICEQFQIKVHIIEEDKTINCAFVEDFIENEPVKQKSLNIFEQEDKANVSKREATLSNDDIEGSGDDVIPNENTLKNEKVQFDDATAKTTEIDSTTTELTQKILKTVYKETTEIKKASTVAYSITSEILSTTELQQNEITVKSTESTTEKQLQKTPIPPFLVPSILREDESKDMISSGKKRARLGDFFTPKTHLKIAPPSTPLLEADQNVEIAAGEAKEGVQKGSTNENKVLLFLFLGVAAVGALAFAYNYIKKRKAKHDEEQGPIEREMKELNSREKEARPLMFVAEEEKENGNVKRFEDEVNAAEVKQNCDTNAEDAVQSFHIPSVKV